VIFLGWLTRIAPRRSFYIADWSVKPRLQGLEAPSDQRIEAWLGLDFSDRSLLTLAVLALVDGTPGERRVAGSRYRRDGGGHWDDRASG
jgi:hypothetical protein